MTPLTSIIIVNYNAGPHLKKAVTASLKLKDVEVIVVDNNSTDNSLALLPKSSNLILIKNDRNLGFAKATHIGVNKSRGQYLVLLNPDTVLTQSALTTMQSELTNRAGEAIIAPALINPDGSPQPSCYHRQTIKSAIKEFWFGKKSAYSKFLPPETHSSVVDVAVAAVWLMTKKTWDKLGGLSQKYFLYFEDLDFCDRASSLGIPTVYVPTAKVIHSHGISAATNPKTGKLFLDSAYLYHGRLKKIIIDFVIRTGSLLSGDTSPKKSLLMWGIAFSVVLALSTLSYFLLPSRAMPSSTLTAPYNQNFLWWGFANFDGEHYLAIAKSGYLTVMGQSQYAFFPLLPLLINLLSKAGLDPYLAARLLTLTSSALAFVVVGLWLKKYFKNSLSPLWLILLGSGSIFLYSIYTEPLFLLFVASTFLFSEQKRWKMAILAAALATATRVTGIFLFPYLLLMMYHSGFGLFKATLSALPSLAGLFSYMTYLYYVAGNPLAFYTAQAGWGKADPTSPLTTLTTYFAAITYEFRFDLTHLVVYLEVFITLALWYLFAFALRKKSYPAPYLVYCFGNLAMPLITGSLGSMPRFALASFPLLALIPSAPTLPRRLLSSLMMIAGMIGTILFIRGYWYA